MVNKCILTIETVDEQTGEIKTQTFDLKDVIKLPTKKSTSSKSKIMEDKTPKLLVEENKYILTSAAIEGLKATPGSSKLDIQYQKIGDMVVPIIFRNTKSGNKLTLGGTVSVRGKKYEELVKYGTNFILVPHPKQPDTYVLTEDGVLPEGNYKSGFSEDKIPQPEDSVESLDELVDKVDDTDFDFTL